GGLYTIYATSGNPSSPPPNSYKLQPYEVRVTVQGGVPGSPGYPPAYRGGLETAFARKTMAAVLPNDVRAAAALELMQPPAISSGLVVHYGPVVLFTTNTWTLATSAVDANQFPRKFSQGNIT